MKIVLAPDSFKGSLSAPRVAAAMADGLRRVWPNAEYVLLPVADGGEGTAEALAKAAAGTLHTASVSGPLGEPTSARWAVLPSADGGENGATLVIEMAEAAGLTKVPPERRDPLRATSHGVGQMLLAALSGLPARPARRLVFALGGTATNDGGAGLLRALGVRLLDGTGRDLPEGGAALADLATLDVSELRFDPRQIAVEVVIACDVDNPLCGPRGASHVFGPQKGASPDDVRVLDAALRRWGEVLDQDAKRTGRSPISEVAGAGAAGGTAAALLWLFPQATLRPGIEIVLDAARFNDHLRGAVLVLTGEGQLDAQTLGGKVVLGVARQAARVGVPCAALVGGLDPATTDEALAQLRQQGLGAVLPVLPGPCTLTDALAAAEAWVRDGAERAARWMALGQSLSPVR